MSRGLDEIKTLRSALNEKKLTAKQKLKEFDDFVKDYLWIKKERWKTKFPPSSFLNKC